ncbi:MAG: hypothetical protein EOO20_18890 [Chryseobacterium sp.]|nr:MAG: hypothetical protein EOO20_18890 [Chryseobacterium sp.]
MSKVNDMRTVLIITLFFQLQFAKAQQAQTSYFADRSLSQTACERKAACKKTTSVALSGTNTAYSRHHSTYKGEAYHFC